MKTFTIRVNLVGQQKLWFLVYSPTVDGAIEAVKTRIHDKHKDLVRGETTINVNEVDSTQILKHRETKMGRKRG